MQAALSLGTVPSGWTLGVLIVLALILGVYLWVNRSHGTSRSEELQKKYEHLTEEMLRSLPDNELTEAVVANRMAKLDEKHPDWVGMLAQSSYGQRSVVAVWLITHEWCEDDSNVYTVVSPEMAEFAADGLETMGAVDCAAALRLDTSDEQKKVAYRDAAQNEHPLDFCNRYIREQPAEFCDAGAQAETVQ